MPKGVKKMEKKKLYDLSGFGTNYIIFTMLKTPDFLNSFWRFNLWEEFFLNTLEYTWNIAI